MNLHSKVTNTLTGHSRRIAVAYRATMIGELRNYLDAVRKGSIQEIIPRNIPLTVNRERRPWILRKLQPSTPGRLTERTGALIKMMSDGIGNWNNSARKSISNNDAIQGEIKVITKGVREGEEYQAQLRANIKSTKYSRYQTKQQLFMRFRWETGIRGQKRQFIDPAARKLFTRTEQIAQMRLNALGGIK
jgi:hypothetical protein